MTYRNSTQERAASGRFIAKGLKAVSWHRFVAIPVRKDSTIRDFVENRGLVFETGRGFYELSKREEIQDYKEVVLEDYNTGDFLSGDKAREILGLPNWGSKKINPDYSLKYRVYVQSTSFNRRLKAGTYFLYEVA